jgi:hypothetical protein
VAHVRVVESPYGRTPIAAADVPHHDAAVSAADVGAALACEIGRLNEEGRRLQVLAARMAQETRPEFEAWFEAGLLLRRASARLEEIAAKLL